MKIHRYRSYRQYVRIQNKKNKRQLDRTWATPEEMEAVAAYVREHLTGARFGLCHGAKHGWEVRALRERLGIDVIGTDISDSTREFDHMIKWDFHETKDEWLGRTDFIYSNCLDHSYDPELCLDRWMACLRPGGLCFIEWSAWHGEEYSDEDDPFGASLDEYRTLVSKTYEIRDELELPANPANMYPLERRILVVARREGSPGAAGGERSGPGTR